MSYPDYVSFIQNKFLYWKEAFEKNAPHPNLLCFQTTRLAPSVLSEAQKFIQTIYKLRNNLQYQEAILGHPISQPHFSVLMSFDFHLTSAGLKLIEINTNASHALTTYSLLEYLEPQRKSFLNVTDKILESFHLEYELFFNKKPSSILILDDDPLNQRAYFEFLMYKGLFESNHLKCEIGDVKNVTSDGSHILYKDHSYDFIYNRFTDFYFENTPDLSQAYKKNRICITPHPEEYKLLADKSRLLNFKDPTFTRRYLTNEDIKIIEDTIPNILYLTVENFESLWTMRKKYFFKPAQAYGSKAAYRGESVSKKKLLEAMKSYQLVAQEYIPAPSTQVVSQNQTLEAKYDLRFYVYNSTIQLVAARLYQGQTTNFKTPGLGLSPVLFDSEH